MAPTSIVYWTRAGMGIITAVVCHFLNLTEVPGSILALTVYALTSVFFEHGVHLKNTKGEPLGTPIWMSGIGTYYILWIMVWTLLNTINAG